MEKICWKFISDTQCLESNSLVKCVGVVIGIVRDVKFISFVVSDMTGSIQAALYENQRNYSNLQLPKIGNSLIIYGQTHKKQFSSDKYFLKLKIKSFKIIDELQQFIIMENILQQAKNNYNQEILSVPKIPKTKRPLLKELKFTIQPLDIRTLILSCVYITLENNVDLESYVFSNETIQKHRLTKSFLEVKKIKQEGINYLTEFIEQGLNYLTTHHIIDKKQEIQDVQLYKVTRKKFADIEMRTMGLINAKKDLNGVSSGELVCEINKQYGFLAQKNYVFNENFIQRILKKFIEEGRVYKSVDKLLYPNI